ncbi:hypothetical protein KPL74_15290 [Bacillus sp. NP157]|nr:hypothetical protein KPL74_15290 [Bacillus sp. NP157]
MSRHLIFLLVMATCSAMVGCGDDRAVVWEAHVKAPDGHYRVNAQTIQQSGPGNAALSTRVKLSQRDDDEGDDILDLSHSQMAEVINGPVKVVWLDNTTLRLEFVPSSHVDFQAIKAAAVTIDAVPMPQ